MQVKYNITVNKIHIANYFLDFLVENNDGSFDYIDIKGKDTKTNKFVKTGVFALKKRLVEAIYGIKISMV
jgi:DNA-binding protein